MYPGVPEHGGRDVPGKEVPEQALVPDPIAIRSAPVSAAARRILSATGVPSSSAITTETGNPCCCSVSGTRRSRPASGRGAADDRAWKRTTSWTPGNLADPLRRAH
ncbi:hypothetical protein [Methanoculleus sp. 10]|uniref:hypothetical protein n=1 Tax=Methanoculleus sp. 10 TaxID=430615 RepID=UPI0025DE0DC8|nr:hypothetical protein [Methanoculleus sp. 10]